MKDQRVSLLHLADCLVRIREYTTGGQTLFMSDRKTQDAVIRNLEIVGQVVRDLGPETLSAQRPEIPWASIAGTRNILAHQYLGVDLTLVWNIVERELEALETAVAALIEAEQS